MLLHTRYQQFKSMMQNTTINLKHYVSVVAHLSLTASKFAKECAQNPNLGKYDKGGNDPVTDADYKIQTYLIKGITHYFPQLKIVGEETVDYKGQIAFDFDQIQLQNYPKDCQLQENVPISELCLWIDPIDNTRGFIKGQLEGVTILIGMTRNKRAYLGIIATPYLKEGDKRIFKPVISMGFVPKGTACQSQDAKNWAPIVKPKSNNPLIISTSSRVSNNAVADITKQLKTEIVRLGGSGRKANMVINGQADALIYLNTSNCRWDSCAGEAIVKAMGGLFTNQLGQQIDYDPSDKDYGNHLGNVCTFDHQLHQQIVQTYAQLKESKI